jgi:hypothetical protein
MKRCTCALVDCTQVKREAGVRVVLVNGETAQMKLVALAHLQ